MLAFVLILFTTLFFLAVICFAFVWAVNSRQYQDLEAESLRILNDDKENPPINKTDTDQ